MRLILYVPKLLMFRLLRRRLASFETSWHVPTLSPVIKSILSWLYQLRLTSSCMFVELIQAEPYFVESMRICQLNCHQDCLLARWVAYT